MEPQAANWSDAQEVWARALREADDDEDVARGLLLARILLELQDLRVRMTMPTLPMQDPGR